MLYLEFQDAEAITWLWQTIHPGCVDNSNEAASQTLQDFCSLDCIKQQKFP